MDFFVPKDGIVFLIRGIGLWECKDLALIICLAVLGLVISALMVQLATPLTGIIGANYVFTILLAIYSSFSLLVYEGRRWKFFFQITLFTLLIFPTYIGGIAFDLFSKIHLVINAFVGDIIFNSIYGIFIKKDRLDLWSILVTVIFWVFNPIFGLLVKPFFFPPEFAFRILDIIYWIMPVIIIESIIGGYIGYKIFMRTKGLLSLEDEGRKIETEESIGIDGGKRLNFNS